MYLKEGTLLKGGSYRIVRFIASGGFGCTYEAVHPILGKRFAIKEFFPQAFCNRDSDTSHITVGTQKLEPLVNKLKEKFFNEACSIAKLSHPNIVRVNDVFEENGTAYYVMDYIDGNSLSAIVNENGPLSEEKSLKYIRQICDALDYVHGKNRLHLDIKPGNIMIDEYDNAILIDFGASKQYDEENGENTSSLLGKTIGYAPLEQMGNDVNHFRPATDIYSLGATLYKCLSGKTPLESNLLAQGEELDSLPEDVSDPTRRAIARAMEISPKKRPQTIKEFLSILNGSEAPEGKPINTVKNEDTLYEYPDSKDLNKASHQNEVGLSSKPQEPALKPSNKSNSDSSKNLNPDNQIIPSATNNKPSEVKSRSSNAKIYLGIACAIIAALICWFAFGGSKNESPSVNQKGDEIAVLADSLKNVDSGITPQSDQIIQEAKEEGVDQPFENEIIDNNNEAEKAPLEVISPSNVKVEGKSIASDAQKISKFSSVSSNISGVDNAQQEIEKSSLTQKELEKTSANLTGTINGHEWVDLGLPSGLKWATTNVGASTPEQNGSYYAWGETRTKSSYSFDNSETYKKDNQWLTKNGYIGSNGNLTLSYDAARRNWGGTWRMPTLNEIKELLNNTTSEWTTRNGVKGRLIKSKKNGNSIFLPASGWYYDTLHKDVGENVSFWSSTPSERSNENAYELLFNTYILGFHWYYRYGGCCVRPVTE